MPNWRNDAARRERREPAQGGEQPKPLRRVVLEFLLGGGLVTALITVAGPEIGDFLDSNEPICENAHDAVQNVKSAEAVPPQLRAA